MSYKDTNSIMTLELHDKIYKYIQRNYLLDINYNHNYEAIDNVMHIILVYLKEHESNHYYINSFDELSLKTQYELLDYLNSLQNYVTSFSKVNNKHIDRNGFINFIKQLYHDPKQSNLMIERYQFMNI